MVYELYGLTEEEIAIVEGRDHRSKWSTYYAERGFSEHSELGPAVVAVQTSTQCPRWATGQEACA